MSDDAREIVLVTCRTWPELSASDTALARELAARGHRVRHHAWNDAPATAFTSADLVVLRSNWDYHHEMDEFDRWLSLVDHGGAELHNPSGLVRSHLHKSYLHHLERAGIRTPQTLVVGDDRAGEVTDWVDACGFDRVVAKPAWGASGDGVELVDRAELARVVGSWRADPTSRTMLVQEFVPEVTGGELALVFFGGRFSHALLRTPAADDFRVNSQYGGTMSVASHVSREAIRFGARVLATLAESATYARVDVVCTGTDHIVMEVEVNEPALGLDLAPGAAARFADALLG